MLAGTLLELIAPSVCPSCDRPRAPGERLLCHRCASGRDALDGLGEVHTAIAYRGTGIELVQRFKFDGRRDALRVLVTALHARLSDLHCDAIVPVPRHRSRIRELGREPARTLASELSRRTGWPLRAAALRRTRATAAQTDLSPGQRRRNVAGSFAAGRRLPAGTLLLLDDVVTTGATLDEAARCLSAGMPGSRLLVAAAAGPPRPADRWPERAGLRYNRTPARPDPGPPTEGAHPMADTIKLTEDISLRYQANLGEDVSSDDFSAGDELTVLQEFDNAWLAKSDDGKLFNVKKDQAEPA